MKLYRIREWLEESSETELSPSESPFAAILTSEEWSRCMGLFDMGIEMDIDLASIRATRAEVNYDSLTGGFSLPSRQHPYAENARFAFALDEKGIVLVDDSGRFEKRSLFSV